VSLIDMNLIRANDYRVIACNCVRDSTELGDLNRASLI